jgi:hypothetical protein
LKRLAVLVLIAAFALSLVPANTWATTEPPTATPEGGGNGTEVTPELPAPDIPTSNQQGYTFKLEAAIRTDLDALPKEQVVYELIRPETSKEEAQKIADRLQIAADVEDKGGGVFEATGTGQVFVSPDVIQYFSLENVGDGDLPTDDEAVAFAREWLRLTGLLPPDLGDARIASRSAESQRLVVQFQPDEPKSILSAYPSITVTLGPKGTILEASLRWGTIERRDLYQLRPASEAWAEVKSGQAFLDVSLPEDEAPAGSEVTGRVTYSGVELAYTTAGPPGGKQYLVPVYVFTGRIRPEGSEKTYPIRAYVTALANSGAPVG